MDDLKTAKVAEYGISYSAVEQMYDHLASLEVQKATMNLLFDRMVPKPKKGSIEAIVADVNARLKER